MSSTYLKHGLPSLTLDLSGIAAASAEVLTSCIRDCWFNGADGLILPTTRAATTLAGHLPGLVPGMSLGLTLTDHDSASQIARAHELRARRLCLSYGALRASFSTAQIKRLVAQFWEIRATVQWQVDSDLHLLEAGMAGIAIEEVLLPPLHENQALWELVATPGQPMAIDWAVSVRADTPLRDIARIRNQGGKLHLMVEDITQALAAVSQWQETQEAANHALN